MGSICYGYKKDFWKIVDRGKIKHSNKAVLNVQVGEWNDYGSSGYLNIWLLEEVYNKVINDEYIVVNQPYSDVPVLIKDKSDNTIDLLLGMKTNVMSTSL